MRPDPLPPQGGAAAADDDALLALLWLASPALPLGGFSYSEGLEAAVEIGLVHDEASAADWLRAQLELAPARADLAIIAAALPAWRQADWDGLRALDGWVMRTRESAELRLQTEQQGHAVVQWLHSLSPELQPCPPPAHVPPDLRQPSYPVAFAWALASLTPPTLPVARALLAAGFAWCESMAQAAIKAVPLGQAAGQRLLARLRAALPALVARAAALPAARRQSFTPMLAILSARHETQYSRLFRS
ncbi:Urease accessory protein UreF [Tepidimonas thermarum]|uniref:Urease accessory protein UreF n=1 Tax=Tepidimonas thermarum TaxID=335431 RepID=A0A554X306_9BURK|nr:urease accessory UreF family protein [Tepidimonas thermarum]TSE30231.1 Urease accessory protein UreF [Tepidimonas thermarum]